MVADFNQPNQPLLDYASGVANIHPMGWERLPRRKRLVNEVGLRAVVQWSDLDHDERYWLVSRALAEADYHNAYKTMEIMVKDYSSIKASSVVVELKRWLKELDNQRVTADAGN